MLSEKMLGTLNEQINIEFSSSYLYLAMSTWFEGINLPGFAHWMLVQYQEEVAHALKIFSHVIERSGTVTLKTVPAPQTSWASPLAAFENVLAHEQKVTGDIYKILDLAGSAKDHATSQFFQWFVAEQVEEEANARQILERVKMAGESKGSLLYIDKELRKRKSGDAPFHAA